MGESTRLLSQELAALGLDLQATLREGPRFLLDARFLGALHAELEERLGPAEARAALLQLGFLHGLRDAIEVLRGGFGAAQGLTACPPMAARLPIRLAPRIVDPRGAGLELWGTWPEQHEAEAVLSTAGPGAAPACHLSAGYTSGWLSGIFDCDLLAVEESCASAGGPHCSFLARDAAAWRETRDVGARAMLDALPFAVLRDVVGRHLEASPTETPGPAAGFDPSAPVVHVWGPVMVVPFSGPEESLRAVELIGREPDARHVRVVVIDLSGTLIDDGFGAAALEQVLDAVESWGAEPILTGVSPLSAPVVAELERTHLVLHKDLPEAIAAGFQIAEAQRRAS